MWQSHILTKANEIVATSAQELSREVRLLPLLGSRFASPSIAKRWAKVLLLQSQRWKTSKRMPASLSSPRRPKGFKLSWVKYMLTASRLGWRKTRSEQFCKWRVSAACRRSKSRSRYNHILTSPDVCLCTYIFDICWFRFFSILRFRPLDWSRLHYVPSDDVALQVLELRMDWT